MDPFKEILSILQGVSSGIPRKYIDWAAFAKLEVYYAFSPKQFQEGVTRLIEATLSWLNEPVASTVEWIREEEVLFEVLSDVLWFLNTRFIRDGAITQGLKSLEGKDGVLSHKKLITEIRVYLYTPYY